MQMRRIEPTVLSVLRFQSTARQYSPGSMARRRCRLSGFARHNPGNQCRPKPCTIQLLVEIDGLSEENPSCYAALFGRPRYRCKTTPSFCGLLEIRLNSIDLLRPNLYFSAILTGKRERLKIRKSDLVMTLNQNDSVVHSAVADLRSQRSSVMPRHPTADGK